MRKIIFHSGILERSFFECIYALWHPGEKYLYMHSDILEKNTFDPGPLQPVYPVQPKITHVKVDKSDQIEVRVWAKTILQTETTFISRDGKRGKTGMNSMKMAKALVAFV